MRPDGIQGCLPHDRISAARGPLKVRDRRGSLPQRGQCRPQPKMRRRQIRLRRNGPLVVPDRL